MYKNKFFLTIKNLINQTNLNSKEIPIFAYLFDNNNIIDFSQNQNNYHCEMILLHRNNIRNKYIFVNVEPCLGCAFHLFNNHIGKVFFGCFNEKTGFQTKYNIKYPNFFGGFFQKQNKDLLKNFFSNKR